MKELIGIEIHEMYNKCIDWAVFAGACIRVGEQFVGRERNETVAA
jgi:hypothetical protein